jgi:hypothetical protein
MENCRRQVKTWNAGKARVAKLRFVTDGDAEKEKGVSLLTPFSYTRCHVDFKRSSLGSLLAPP